VITENDRIDRINGFRYVSLHPEHQMLRKTLRDLKLPEFSAELEDGASGFSYESDCYKVKSVFSADIATYWNCPITPSVVIKFTQMT
jgi:hypothetical protein